MARRKQDWTPREPLHRQQVYNLWAVKVYERRWIVVGIFEDRAAAVNLIRRIESDHGRPFPLIAPKLFHPSKELVQAWTANGNAIL